MARFGQLSAALNRWMRAGVVNSFVQRHRLFRVSKYDSGCAADTGVLHLLRNGNGSGKIPEGLRLGWRPVRLMGYIHPIAQLVVHSARGILDYRHETLYSNSSLFDF